jgi:hypothetical protein
MPLRHNYRTAINRTLKGDPDFRRYAINALEVLDQKPSLIVKFTDGELKVPFIDIYCQTPLQNRVTFEDLVLTAIAWQHILCGQLVYRFIEVSECPYSDKEIEKNRGILTDMVKHYNTRNMYGIESADFWGGTKDADGYIKFSEPFIKCFKGMTVSMEKQSDNSGNPNNCDNGTCKDFPLEIGYCTPDQIEMHFSKSKCVARFPYGYNLIVFLESKRKWER